MKILFSFLLILTFQIIAAADSNSASIKLDLELKLQEKIKSILLPLDPQAQVLVTVKSRPISSDLPGMNFGLEDFEPLAPGAGFKFDDIEKVNIKIYSRMQNLPMQVKQLVESSINFEAKKKNIEYMTYDAETIKSLEETIAASPLALLQQDTSKVGKYFGNSNQGITQQWPILLCSLIFTIMAGFLISVLKAGQRTIREAAATVSQAYSQNKIAPHFQETIEMKPSGKNFIASAPPINEPNDNGIILTLQPASILSLFSDAYWCKKDEYASWLWTKMAINQKISILNDLSFGANYANYLSAVEPICEVKFHFLPYYLQPLNMHEVSQDDLYQFIKNNKSMWHFISPMRKSDMKLNIHERLDFESAKKGTGLTTVPLQSPVQRTLVGSFQSGSLTVDDDQNIFENPLLIPVERRKGFLSLAWIAILPAADQQKLFVNYSASDIAQIWVASPAVLQTLEAAVGPKKMKLVHDFLKRRSPNRESVEFKSIVYEAIDLLSIENPIATERNRAA